MEVKMRDGDYSKVDTGEGRPKGHENYPGGDSENDECRPAKQHNEQSQSRNPAVLLSIDCRGLRPCFLPLVLDKLILEVGGISDGWSIISAFSFRNGWMRDAKELKGKKNPMYVHKEIKEEGNEEEERKNKSLE